jgi:hypothetical protein
MKGIADARLKKNASQMDREKKRKQSNKTKKRKKTESRNKNMQDDHDAVVI